MNDKTIPEENKTDQLDGQKPNQTFNCPWQGCGRLFRAQFSLNRHMVLHTQAKKYICKLCQRSFSLPQYLREHEYTHTKELPYECGVSGCAMRFRQAGKLSLHRRTHPEYTTKKYDYTLNCEKRSKTKGREESYAKSQDPVEKCGVTYNKVTKISEKNQSGEETAKDATHGLSHPSHGPIEDCFCLNQNQSQPLKPLPQLVHSIDCGAEVQKIKIVSCGVNAIQGADGVVHCQNESIRFIPLLDYLRENGGNDLKPILPMPPRAAVIARPVFSGLDLFSLIRDNENRPSSIL